MRLVRLRSAMIAGLALAGAALSAQSAALGYWRAQPAASVPRSMSGDPTIGLNALRAVAAEASPAAGAALAGAARAIMSRDPLDPRAFAGLGATLLPGNPARASKLLHLGERMTRRDLGTQFMLIELAARERAVPAVLIHYDRAMTVHPATMAVLGPILARGLTYPEIRAGLVRYGGRPWFGPFVDAALANGAEPTSLVALVDAASATMPGDRLRQSADLLADRLQNAGRVAELRALVAGLPASLTAPFARFALPQAGAGPGLATLDWSLADDAQAQAAISPGFGLIIEVAPEQRRTAAHRTTLLEAGNYLLRQSISADEAPLARLDWSVSCLGQGSAQATISQIAPAAASGEQTFAVALPQGCLVQQWQLFATGARAQGPSRAVLSHFSLRRVGD